jgi:hypothetical protein
MSGECVSLRPAACELMAARFDEVWKEKENFHFDRLPTNQKKISETQKKKKKKKSRVFFRNSLRGRRPDRAGDFLCFGARAWMIFEFFMVMMTSSCHPVSCSIY